MHVEKILFIYLSEKKKYISAPSLSSHAKLLSLSLSEDNFQFPGLQETSQIMKPVVSSALRCFKALSFRCLPMNDPISPQFFFSLPSTYSIC